MTKHLVFIVLSVCLVLFALPGSAAPDDRGDRVCIYSDENFHGHEQCYRPGDEVSDLKRAEIESIRVSGHTRAILYEDRDFRGRMMNFSTDVPDLKRVWHRDVGSLRITSDYDRERSYD